MPMEHPACVLPDVWNKIAAKGGSVAQDCGADGQQALKRHAARRRRGWIGLAKTAAKKHCLTGKRKPQGNRRSL